MNSVQRLLNNWVHSDWKFLSAATTIQLPKNKGEWNLVNVKSAIKAHSAMMIKKLFILQET